MFDIKRIVIKSSSGNGPASYAYDDQLEIKDNSISYEYRPIYETERNPKQKWSYTSEGQCFLKYYKQIREKAEKFAHPAQITDEKVIHDSQTITFEITYSGQTVIKKTFYDDFERFKELFDLITLLVPGCEEKPRLFWNAEDYNGTDRFEWTDEDLKYIQSTQS